MIDVSSATAWLIIHKIGHAMKERDTLYKLSNIIEMGSKKGRSARPNLKVGICGEHGGDPDSVEFCHRVGIDYVSCSPYRVPIARLAAAQAAVKEKLSGEFFVDK